MKTEREIIQLERIRDRIKEFRSELSDVCFKAESLDDIDWDDVGIDPDLEQLADFMRDSIGLCDDAITIINEQVEEYEESDGDE